MSRFFTREEEEREEERCETYEKVCKVCGGTGTNSDGFTCESCGGER